MPDWLFSLLNDYGYLILFLVVFLNNAGIPLPGDTFLLAAGALSEGGLLAPHWTVAAGAAACFLGGTLGYEVGRRMGRRLLTHPRWFRLGPDKMDRIDRFFQRYGPKAVFFARFVALVHPVTGILAGVGGIPRRIFMVYNLAGSVAYSLCYTFLGYFFGESWDWLKAWLGKTAVYFLALLLVLVLLTTVLRRPLSGLLERFSNKRKG